MIIYQAEERAKDLVDEIKPLIAKHWEEIALFKDQIKLNPDFDKYIELDEQDMLHIVTARREEDLKLIGYFISVVQTNIHYKDHLFATNDILFIDPEYRGKLAGVKLFKYAEKKLKEKGVSIISIHMKTHMPFDKLLERLKYEKQEYNYMKYIGE